MVTDQQVRKLRKLMKTEKTMVIAASKTGMDEKTARKYLKEEKLPSQMKRPHNWKTHPDPFVKDWDELKEKLEVNPGLEAKTLFEYLQRKEPGRYQDGQLRTLQRRIKVWRALEGPTKEVYFPQIHYPGDLCESDFSHMTELQVTVQGRVLEHLFYHFVLTYSNWEDVTFCHTESLETLSEGFQNALGRLGGVPKRHRTDRMSAAVNNLNRKGEFTKRYEGLMRHYAIQSERIQAGKAHENGDVEQRHHRFKRALEQALLLRGSRDFENKAQYKGFCRKLLEQLNAGRRERLQEEVKLLRELPLRRLDDVQRLKVRVGASSTIHVKHGVYSVPSRLIKEWVEVRLYGEHLEVWYGQKKVESMPRLHGSQGHRIHYRHVIDWLVRKPGAFENYRYQGDLFPTSRFRMAYDILKRQRPLRAGRTYLQILSLAAKESETGVDEALRLLFDHGKEVTEENVREMLSTSSSLNPVRELQIQPVELSLYDELLSSREMDFQKTEGYPNKDDPEKMSLSPSSKDFSSRRVNHSTHAGI